MLPSRLARTSFNGTTFFQTWKFSAPAPAPAPLARLQWNHVFSNVEILTPFPNQKGGEAASMEPRFFKRGNNSEALRAGVLIARFNGTTFFQTWKFDVKKVEVDVSGEALQWNHVFSNVEIKRARRKAFRAVPLQWNHVFSNVEISVIVGIALQNRIASMEPRFFKRGNLGRDGIAGKRHRASMEPRFFKRGNAASASRTIPASGRFNGTTFFQTWKLLGLLGFKKTVTSFNGTTFFQTWK